MHASAAKFNLLTEMLSPEFIDSFGRGCPQRICIAWHGRGDVTGRVGISWAGILRQKAAKFCGLVAAES